MKFFDLGEFVSRTWPRASISVSTGRESMEASDLALSGSERPSLNPPRFKRRNRDRRRGMERRGKVEVPRGVWADLWSGLWRARRSDPTFWLVGLFLTAAVLTWCLPSWKVEGSIVAF